MSCCRCGDVDDRRLYGRVSPTRLLCLECWERLGRPWPLADNLTAEELHTLEERTRQRMLERGGTDRHLVRVGKT